MARSRNKKHVSHVPTVKDDGTRWIILRAGHQVYPGAGSTAAEAKRLNDGLQDPGELVQV